MRAAPISTIGRVRRTGRARRLSRAAILVN
jgi:hypothetical protein